MEAVIFGAGNDGKVLKKGLEKYYDIHVCAVCDNDANKWGRRIDGIQIMPPQELTEIEFEIMQNTEDKETLYKG